MHVANYDPTIEPNAEEWLRLSETERNDLAYQYHLKANERLPEDAMAIHAALHVIVENQNALGTPPVPETVQRLQRQGLTRHEAIHAVAAVLSNDVFEILHGEDAAWNPAKYRRKLEKLTAKRWRKGQV
jgi:hypothetical protein